MAVWLVSWHNYLINLIFYYYFFLTKAAFTLICELKLHWEDHLGYYQAYLEVIHFCEFKL